MLRILLGSGIGALLLAVAGFLFGAAVPDENAGLAALWLAKIGAVVGGTLGAAVGWIA